MIRIKVSVLCFLSLVVLAGLATAAVPRQMNYQGRLTDASGQPVDTTADLTIVIFDDDSGSNPLWGETHLGVSVADGLFDLRLGAINPIPDSVFDGSARWLGVQIEDGPVSTPLIAIVSSAYSMRSRVSDTAAYAHAGPGSGATGWTDDGNRVRLTADSDSVGIGTTLPQAKLHVEGNLYTTQGVTFGQGNTNSGYQSLINGEGNTASGNYSAITGGASNEVSGDYALVGSGRNNQAVGDYSAIAGGYGDTATGVFSFIAGNANKVSGNYSSIGGGCYNYVEGSYSSVSGGGPSDVGNPTTRFNAVFDDFGTIGGGGGNYVGDDNGDPESARYGVVAGGYENEASATYSSVGGGTSNNAGSYASTVGGGQINATTGDYAAIGGGYSNQANGNYSTIAGGRGHTADQQYSAVGGGYANNAAGAVSVVAGGLQNYAGGSFSSVGGGASNVALGDYSVVLGGFGDTIAATADYSYLFGIQSVLNEDSTFMVDMPHIRFGDEATGYEFPTSGGAEGEVLVSDASGVLSWADPTTLEPRWLLSDSVLYTAHRWGLARGGSENEMLGDSAHTLVNLGAWCSAGKIESSNHGGAYATIAGGKENTASDSYTFVGSGRLNVAGNYNAVVCGGYSDSASGSWSFVGGGSQNTAAGNYAAICGGSHVQARGLHSAALSGKNNLAGDDEYDTAAVVVGGWFNSVSEPMGFIGGGHFNKAGRYAAVVGGKSNNGIGEFAFIGGGKIDTVESPYGGVASGYHNRAGEVADRDTAAFVGGGWENSAEGKYSCVLGGKYDTALAHYSTIGGGTNNITTGGMHSTIGGGWLNLAQGESATIAGGYVNNALSSTAAIGGGEYNIVLNRASTIAGGSNNHVGAEFSAILGGFGDTILAGADYSYLFGLKSVLSQDSTFMVDMPHIRFGDESTGFEFPSTDGTVGQVLATDGSGQLSWVGQVGGSDLWALSDQVVFTSDQYGIARGNAGNILLGSGANTMVNLGSNSATLDYYATISGGEADTVESRWGFIGGGYGNIVGNAATDSATAIVGGFNNSATNTFSFIGGGRDNEALGSHSVIGGGIGNGTLGKANTVGGGEDNAAYSTWGTVAGGYSNSAGITPPDTAATVAGGYNNTVTDDYGFVGGGRENEAGRAAVVAGGEANVADGDLGFVGGGKNNTAAQESAVGGGQNNSASGVASAVVGGLRNTSAGDGSLVGAGVDNRADGLRSVVAGGRRNHAVGDYSFVVGDYDTASGANSCAIGGQYNVAAGAGSFATGSHSRAMGATSIAMGLYAEASHDRSVVISASNDFSHVTSGCSNQMVLCAQYDFYFARDAGTAPCRDGRFLDTQTGGYLSNGGTWTNASDRNAKENFTSVDGQELLDKIADLPITEWSYIEDEDDVRHIGPVAQDFYALFGVGADDVSISTVDPAGIALAAIKELNRKTQRIDAQQKEIDELRSQLAEIKGLLEELAAE